jgi:chromate transporter
VRLFVPDLATIDWISLLIAAAAFMALFRYKVSMLATLAGAAAIGLIYYLLFLGS